MLIVLLVIFCWFLLGAIGLFLILCTDILDRSRWNENCEITYMDVEHSMRYTTEDLVGSMCLVCCGPLLFIIGIGFFVSAVHARSRIKYQKPTTSEWAARCLYKMIKWFQRSKRTNKTNQIITEENKNDNK